MFFMACSSLRNPKVRAAAKFFAVKILGKVDLKGLRSDGRGKINLVRYSITRRRISPDELVAVRALPISRMMRR